MEGPEPSKSHARMTRAKALPQIKCYFPLTEAYTKSISYTGPRYWEILPGKLKTITELKAFKSEIKKYYRDLFI